MQIEVKDNIAFISYEKNDVMGRPFRDEIKRNYKTISSNNIILDLSSMDTVMSKHIKDFSELATYHTKTNKKSFVLVTGPLSLKLLPEGLEVVPTMNEALDTVEIEEIERDLGF